MNYLRKVSQFLICLFVFLVPWQTVFIIQERFINGYKWQGGTLAIFATELILWAILLIELIILIKERRIFDKFEIRNIDKRRFFLVLAVWVFLFWSLSSLIWSSDKQVAFLSWFHLLEVVALFFVLIRNRINLKCLCWSVVLSSVIQSVLAMWQFFSQTIYASKWLGIAEHLPYKVGTYVIENSDGRWLRAYGSLAHPNVLAGFLTLGFFCALFLYLESKGKVRLLFLSFISLIAVGIFLSFSRGVWLAMAISYALWLFLEVRKRMSKRESIKHVVLVSFTLVLLAISFIIIYKPLLVSRFSLSDRLEVKSNTQRINSLSQSWNVIIDRGSAGVGMGNYLPTIHRIFPDLPGWSYEPAHNIYLLIWAELGSFGLIIFLVIYALVLVRCLREDNYLFFALALSLGIVSLFDHYFWTQYVGLTMWWLALVFCIKSSKFRQ